MRCLPVLLCVLLLAGCRDDARLQVADGTGPNPRLPEPREQTIPTVNIAPARGWPAGVVPVAAPGLQVQAFATGLDHPRWIHVLPNGDVLVAETNAPDRPVEKQGLRAKIMGRVMRKAGAATPSANRISLWRDADGDGVAELHTAFLEGVNSPFGMQLVGNELYIAATDAVLRVPYVVDTTRIDAKPVQVAALPAGPRNHHWTKNLIVGPRGDKLYVTAGSNSNVAEHGMDEEVERAAILEMNLDGSGRRIFASGLRNPNGLAWEPVSGRLWTTVNERDEIGSDLVPDYMTSVRDGAFYGWPYSYYGQHVDVRVKPPRPDLVAKAIAPDYALGPHVAALGLAFNTGTLLPAHYAGGAFVGQHGSWNRNPPSGYKVVFVPFAGGRPTGPIEDVLTGFLDKDGNAHGRPVGVAIARDGALLVADDVGNVIWRVSPQRAAATR